MTHIVAALVLFGATIAVFSIDRKMRFSSGSYAKGYGSAGEPDVGTLLVLCILFNIACLPYYFYKTRGGIGIVVGFGFFVLCFLLMLVAKVAFAMAMRL
jgi:hypothetical protein